MKNIESNKGEIVMYQPDETIRLEVRMGEETVWLTQQQMAELFDTDRSSINKHINNIFETEELAEEPTYAKIAQVRKEGKRMVKRQLVYYNLDMIISVGYRVNSKRGTKFRQWANQVLKDYLLKGYVVNQRITTLEHQVAELTEKVNFFVRSSLPPVEGIFWAQRGQELLRPVDATATLVYDRNQHVERCLSFHSSIHYLRSIIRLQRYRKYFIFPKVFSNLFAESEKLIIFAAP